MFAPLSSANTNADIQIPQVPQLSSSDEHGCKAYLCFAGGMAFPECQPTIRKVKRDLVKGRGFPQCSFLSNKDGSVGGQNGSPIIWSNTSKRRVTVMMKEADGTVKQISSFKRR